MNLEILSLEALIEIANAISRDIDRFATTQQGDDAHTVRVILELDLMFDLVTGQIDRLTMEDTNFQISDHVVYPQYGSVPL